MAETYQHLREMSLGQLISEHDKVAQPWQPDPAHFLAEIARRDQEKQTEVMLKYTRWITFMTFVIVVATVILLFKD